MKVVDKVLEFLRLKHKPDPLLDETKPQYEDLLEHFRTLERTKRENQRRQQRQSDGT